MTTEQKPNGRRSTRRHLIAGAIATVAAAPVAAQDSVLTSIAAQLREQGYQIERVQRTWLGRIRVLAQSDTHTREVVFVPTTGEVLRDYWEQKDGKASGSKLSTVGNNGKSASAGNKGKSATAGRNGNSGGNRGGNGGGNSGGNGGGGGGGGGGRNK